MLGRGLADPLPLDLWIFQMLAVTGRVASRRVGWLEGGMMIVGYCWMSCSLEQLWVTKKTVGYELGTSFFFFLEGGVEIQS